jgi:uncharacterized SAM-binding protein YcdF (DUF218 family)
VLVLARRLAAGALAVLLLYLGVTFVQVWRAARRDEARRADAIVVFGAAQYDGKPSPVLRARLDHARELYRRRLAGVIVVTGGRQRGDRFTEAAAAAGYLGRGGVPESDILREVHGRNSWESLASAANELKKRGRDQVVLVSDPFHSARIAAMAEELGLEAAVSPTRSSPISGPKEATYLVRESLAVAAGRVVGFRRLVGVDHVIEHSRDALESR